MTEREKMQSVEQAVSEMRSIRDEMLAEIISQLREDLAVAVEALKFYRNLENYLASINPEPRIGFDYKNTPVHVDSGEKARLVLARISHKPVKE